jgi:hypothetical protein
MIPPKAKMIPPKTNQFSIEAVWGPSRETPDVIAGRFTRLIDRLGTIDPVFGNWLWVAKGEGVAFEEVRARLPGAIAAKIARADDGDPTPIYGYRFSVINSEEISPRSISVRVHAGSWDDAPYCVNNAVVQTSWGVIPDPAIVTYPISKAAILALAASFGANWCSACPGELEEFWRAVPPYYRLGWISYVGPRFAHLITPPSRAIVERQPNGGLLMAATDDTFSVSNPAHLAAARDILASVAPLNALPWPPDAEPADV